METGRHGETETSPRHRVNLSPKGQHGRQHSLFPCLPVSLPQASFLARGKLYAGEGEALGESTSYLPHDRVTQMAVHL